MERKSAFLAASLAIVMFSTVGWASVTTWTATTGDWAVPGNWDTGMPTSATNAYITNGGTATISGLGAQVSWLYLGGTGTSGSVVMNSGSLDMYGSADFVGTGLGGTGTFTLNSGTITTADGCQLEVGSFRGGCSGTFYQYGGTVQSLDPNWATAGAGADEAYYIGSYATGTYLLADGILNSPWTSVGYGGNPVWAGSAPGIGYFVQTGGTHTTALLIVGAGWDNGGTGTYTISGAGNLNAKDVALGMKDGSGTNLTRPNGTFNQNGGTVTITHALTAGSDFFTQSGGSGGEGIGTYNFNSGTLTDGGAGAGMIVRDGAGATGTFQGLGVVNFTGTLTNNGRVIADGGTLDLSRFSVVTNTVANVTTPFNGRITIAGATGSAGGGANGAFDYAGQFSGHPYWQNFGWYISSTDGVNYYVSNTQGGLGVITSHLPDGTPVFDYSAGYQLGGGNWIGTYAPEGVVTGSPASVATTYATTNGWFAKNGGKLTLPPVVATAAAPSVNWGENPAAATLTLVNSAQVTVHGLVGSASFAVSLDDPANAEVPNPSGLSNLVGVWNVGVTPSGSLTSWDLALRYDDVAAGSNESSLSLFDSTGGGWTKVPDTLDVVNHVISAAALNLPSGAFFAVGTATPGDTNIDGAINSLDIDAIYRHLTQVPPNYIGTWPRTILTWSPLLAQYDVNNDSAVTQADVTYELNHYFLTSYGDANLDKATGFMDFQALLNHWQNSGADIGWTQGDFNGDGTVDFLDFQNLLNYWNPGGWNFAPSQTPEPASLTLILLGGLALLRRKK